MQVRTKLKSKSKVKPQPVVVHNIKIESTQEEVKINIEVAGFTADIWVDRKRTKVLDEIVQRAMPMLMSYMSQLRQPAEGVKVPSSETMYSTTDVSEEIIAAYQAVLAAQATASKHPTTKNRAAAKRAEKVYGKVIDAWRKSKGTDAK